MHWVCNGTVLNITFPFHERLSTILHTAFVVSLLPDDVREPNQTPPKKAPFLAQNYTQGHYASQPGKEKPESERSTKGELVMLHINFFVGSYSCKLISAFQYHYCDKNTLTVVKFSFLTALSKQTGAQKAAIGQIGE